MSANPKRTAKGALRVIPCGDYVRSWAAPLTTPKPEARRRGDLPPFSETDQPCPRSQCDRGGGYRAGVEITDERTGLVHDYTRKGGVLHSELILPGGGTADRAEFWNGIEAHHKRGDAVLVREVEISCRPS